MKKEWLDRIRELGFSTRDDYIDPTEKTPIRLHHKKAGCMHTTYVLPYALMQRDIVCNVCHDKAVAKRRMKTYDEIILVMRGINFRLLWTNDEYNELCTSNDTIMPIACILGHDVSRSWNGLKSDRKCRECIDVFKHEIFSADEARCEEILTSYRCARIIAQAENKTKYLAHGIEHKCDDCGEHINMEACGICGKHDDHIGKFYHIDKCRFCESKSTYGRYVISMFLSHLNIKHSTRYCVRAKEYPSGYEIHRHYRNMKYDIMIKSRKYGRIFIEFDGKNQLSVPKKQYDNAQKGILAMLNYWPLLRISHNDYENIEHIIINFMKRLKYVDRKINDIMYSNYEDYKYLRVDTAAMHINTLMQADPASITEDDWARFYTIEDLMLKIRLGLKRQNHIALKFIGHTSKGFRTIIQCNDCYKQKTVSINIFSDMVRCSCNKNKLTLQDEFTDLVESMNYKIIDIDALYSTGKALIECVNYHQSAHTLESLISCKYCDVEVKIKDRRQIIDDIIDRKGDEIIRYNGIHKLTLIACGGICHGARYVILNDYLNEFNSRSCKRCKKVEKAMSMGDNCVNKYNQMIHILALENWRQPHFSVDDFRGGYRRIYVECPNNHETSTSFNRYVNFHERCIYCECEQNTGNFIGYTNILKNFFAKRGYRVIYYDHNDRLGRISLVCIHNLTCVMNAVTIDNLGCDINPECGCKIFMNPGEFTAMIDRARPRQ